MLYFGNFSKYLLNFFSLSSSSLWIRSCHYSTLLSTYKIWTDLEMWVHLCSICVQWTFNIKVIFHISSLKKREIDALLCRFWNLWLFSQNLVLFPTKDTFVNSLVFGFSCDAQHKKQRKWRTISWIVCRWKVSFVKREYIYYHFCVHNEFEEATCKQKETLKVNVKFSRNHLTISY